MQTTKPINAELDVIAVISNPVRYRRRYQLYREFEKHVLDSGARLTTIEAAFGDRPHEVTDSACNQHIQLRTSHELWNKENLINLAINRLPASAEYIAWIDADIAFTRPDWVPETLHLLQHFPIIQMFQVALDLSPTYEMFYKHTGFAYSYWKKLTTGAAYEFWHPGYAWAARREAIDGIGGLIDWAILGAADHHMATALIGNAMSSCHGGVHPNYKKKLLQWQHEADKHIKRNIGYMNGTIMHYWHGKKKDRNYKGRWEVLTENQYDPEVDLKRDSQGLWQLTDRNHKLRDGIRTYFRQRNEDSIDLE